MLNIHTLFLLSLEKTDYLNNILALFFAKFDKFHTAVIHEFGANGIYIIAAFAGFLALIAFIYIKSVIDTFRIADGVTSDTGLFYSSVSTGGNQVSKVDDETEEMSEDSRPRLKQLDTTFASPENTLSDKYSEEKDEKTDRNQQPTAVKDFSAKRQTALLEKEQELSRALVESSSVTDDFLNLKDRLKSQTKQSLGSRLDWQKNLPDIQDDLDQKTVLFYQKPQESLDELISLIINMLSRNVTPEKAAQAVYYRNQGKNSEEEIIQTIAAVRDFISICNTGKFATLPQNEELPTGNEALYSWAKGDNSLCLSLLEGLINYQIDKAETQEGLVKELSYAQAASYACLFGTIAGKDNLELAQNSFELALELAPQNINAWSRCGDVYWQQGNFEKAVYAYQTVAESGNDVLYASQIANANHKLAEYYSSSGQSESARKLEQDSQAYYKASGITELLTPKENENLNFIAENQQTNLQNAIFKLLQNQQAQYH